MKFTKWTHPKTGKIRVYVNGADFGRGLKIYVADGADSGRYEAGYAEIFIYDSFGQIPKSDEDAIVNVIDEFVVEKMGGRDRENYRAPAFSDYLAITEESAYARA